MLLLQELEVTAKILLAKGGETSGFIRDDVEKALTAMVCSLTPTRVLVSLISGGARSVCTEMFHMVLFSLSSHACMTSCTNTPFENCHAAIHLQVTLTVFTYYFLLTTFSHRNVAVRKTTAQFLSLLAERMGVSRLMSGAKDVTEKILPTAAQFVTDGGPETRYTCAENPFFMPTVSILIFAHICFGRYYGRKILHIVYDHPEFDKLVSKHVPSNLQKNVRDTVENLRTKVSNRYTFTFACQAVLLFLLRDKPYHISGRRYFLCLVF